MIKGEDEQIFSILLLSLAIVIYVLLFLFLLTFNKRRLRRKEFNNMPLDWSVVISRIYAILIDMCIYPFLGVTFLVILEVIHVFKDHYLLLLLRPLLLVFIIYFLLSISTFLKKESIGYSLLNIRIIKIDKNIPSISVYMARNFFRALSLSIILLLFFNFAIWVNFKNYSLPFLAMILFAIVDVTYIAIDKRFMRITDKLLNVVVVKSNIL